MIPDKDKPGDVAFFVNVNLTNPSSLSDISVVLKKYVEGSHWPCKENFHVEEMGLSSLREREIILKIALKRKWAKSQKLFKSWIEGRQPCIYLNKFHSYTVVVNPELDYLFFQKHSFCGCCSQLHREPGCAPLRVSQRHRLGRFRNTSQCGKETVWQCGAEWSVFPSW